MSDLVYEKSYVKVMRPLYKSAKPDTSKQGTEDCTLIEQWAQHAWYCFSLPINVIEQHLLSHSRDFALTVLWQLLELYQILLFSSVRTVMSFIEQPHKS